MNTSQLAESNVHGVQAIWNPGAAANWSLLFTPVFGSYLHMVNWSALGEHNKATESRKWFYASIIMLVGIILAGVFLQSDEAVGAAIRGVAVGYLIVWYFVSARPQVEYVKKKLSDDYPRRTWKKPLLYAIGIEAGYFLLVFMVGLAVAVARGGA